MSDIIFKSLPLNIYKPTLKELPIMESLFKLMLSKAYFKMKKSKIMINISDISLYIDPGSFSAIFAAILGAIVGGVMFLKTKWHSIRYRKKL